MKPVQLIAFATCVMALGVPGAHAGEPVRSAGKLAFADAGTLFAADWQGARIHAFSVPQPAKAAGRPFNLKDVQGPIAKALQVDRSCLRFEDMAVQPGAEIAYVSLSVQRGKSSPTPALVSINADGRIEVINLKTTAASSATIADAPAPELKFWRDMPAQSLTVTGMTFHANKLYGAGLSNRTFASTTRIYDYPFLRASDFVNEYDFAGFQYQPGDGFREYHKLFQALEGYPELAN